MTVTYEVGGASSGNQLDIDFYVGHRFLASQIPHKRDVWRRAYILSEVQCRTLTLESIGV